MNHSINLPTINCSYCDYNSHFLNSSSNFIVYSNSFIIRYKCTCGNMYIDMYDRNIYDIDKVSIEKFSFHMNLQDDYKIEIHTLFQNKPIVFYFLHLNYDEKVLLTLDYIPDLDWKNSNNLLDQLKLLTTFT